MKIPKNRIRRYTQKDRDVKKAFCKIDKYIIENEEIMDILVYIYAEYNLKIRLSFVEDNCTHH